MTKVVVLGGGMGGLSAAFELASRGFDVDVYEKLDIFGGKARSFHVPGTETEDKPGYPAEHGFRVFPGWYAHVTNTMERIPYTGRGAKPGMTVKDRLVKVPYLSYAMDNEAPFVFDTGIPASVEEWLVELKAIFTHKRLGLRREDGEFFIRQFLQFLGSCEQRRMDVYEKENWFKYIEASRSEAYERVCANGLTRSLVATRPRKSSTYTVALILTQMVYSMVRGGETDRILDGPTSEVWIDSWVSYLRDELGVNFHASTHVENMKFDGDRMVSADITIGDETKKVEADQFVCALPVEVVRTLLTPDQLRYAGLVTDDGVNIEKLEVSWMNGIMYYTNTSAAMVQGHVIYIDSEWALTSVSQAQFWAEEFQPKLYGNGEVVDILSSIISEWDSEENPAEDCDSRKAVKDGAWKQIARARPETEQNHVSEDQIVMSYMDPDIKDANIKATFTNTEPLLTNTVGSIARRPEAKTSLSNLVFASDYVKTYTNLATMEGANEAGRRAANCILDSVGWEGERAMVVPLEEPELFKSWKEEDAASYDPANLGEPPITRFVDEFLGGTNWIILRLFGLGVALGLHWLFHKIAKLFGYGEQYAHLQKSHEARNRKLITPDAGQRT